jgi:hypothetical protein
LTSFIFGLFFFFFLSHLMQGATLGEDFHHHRRQVKLHPLHSIIQGFHLISAIDLILLNVQLEEAVTRAEQGVAAGHSPDGSGRLAEALTALANLCAQQATTLRRQLPGSYPPTRLGVGGSSGLTPDP